MSALDLSMGGAFWNLTDAIAFTIVSTTAVDFEAIEVPENQVYFDGMLQPMKPRDLMIKPEGERKWKWWMLFTEQVLKLDSILKDETGVDYRVMRLSDWRIGDFEAYEIVQAPYPPFAGR